MGWRSADFALTTAIDESRRQPDQVNSPVRHAGNPNPPSALARCISPTPLDGAIILDVAAESRKPFLTYGVGSPVRCPTWRAAAIVRVSSAGAIP